MMRAFLENIIYRLFAFSLAVLILKSLRIESIATIAAAMVLIQCVNVWYNVVALEQMAATLLVYDAVRYVVPGVFWAWIYRRFGFVTNEVASVGCHVFLQPAFSVFV